MFLEDTQEESQFSWIFVICDFKWMIKIKSVHKNKIRQGLID